VTLKPASADTSIPSPLEITVMSCPSNVDPAQVAIAVMGLRLGYAHYNDWTSLPAPLFFKRKIEDYIVRYREGEGAAPDEAPPAPAPAPAPESEAGEGESVLEPEVPARAVLALAQSMLQEAAATVSKAEAPAAERSSPVTPLSASVKVQPDDGSLLARARRTEVEYLYLSDDLKVKRLYQVMLQDDPRVTIRVDVPSFVTTEALFGDITIDSRTCKRLWGRLQQFGYARQTAGAPAAKRFFEWMTQRLNRPQVIFALDSSWKSMRVPFLLSPFRAVIDRYNKQAEDRLKVQVESLGQLKPVAEWAVASDDDESVAWLLFAAAQMPAYGCARAVLDGVTSLPGPRSEEALDYFLRSAEACSEAIKNKGRVARGFPPIHKKADSNYRLASFDGDLDEKADEEIKREIVAVKPLDARRGNDESQIMNIKAQILSQMKALVDGLEPGEMQFQDGLKVIRERLAELEGIHEQRQADRRAELGRQRENDARISALGEWAERLITQIDALRPDFALGALRYMPATLSDMEIVTKRLERIEAALAHVQARRQSLDSLRPLPLNPSIAQRRDYNLQEAEVTNMVIEAIESLQIAVKECGSFLVAEQDSGDAGAAASPAQGSNVEVREHVAPAEAALVQSAAEAPATAVANAAVEWAHEVARPMPSPTAPQSSEALSAAEVVSQNVEIEEEDEEPSESVPSGVLADEMAFDTLLKLVGQRRYALAKMHVRALGELLPGPAFGSHVTILNALFSALDSVDCGFTIEAKLDAALGDLLITAPPGPGEYSDVLPLALGALGAGVIAALFQEQGSDSRWTVISYLQSRFLDHASLSSLIARIEGLERMGSSMTRDWFTASKVGPIKAIEAELARMKVRASGWSRDSDIYSAWSHRGYRKLHDEMFSLQYAVGHCVSLVARGEFDKLEAAYEDARKKFEKPTQSLDELTRRVKERIKPDGINRNWLVGNLEATQQFIQNCIALVSRSRNPNAEVPAKVQQYMNGLYGDLVGAISEVRRLEAHRPVERLYIDSTVRMLGAVLQLFDDRRPDACVPDDQQLLLVQLAMGRDFLPSMGRLSAQTVDTPTVVCRPEDVLEETRRLSTEPLVLNSMDEDRGLVPALEDALERHISSNRFIPAFALSHLQQRSAVSKEQSINAAYLRARSLLDSLLHEARQRVAHAMALSALETAEANRMNRVIEDIRIANSVGAGIGHPKGDSVSYPDFPHARAALRRDVLDVLDTKLSDISAKLSHQIHAYEAEYGQDASRDIARIREMMASNNASSLRAAHDSFALLKKDGRLPRTGAEARNSVGAYSEFVAQIRGLSGSHKGLDALSRKLEAEPSEQDPDWLKALTVAERTEATQFISQWTELVAAQSSLTDDHLKAFFKSIGLAKLPNCAQESVRTFGRVSFYFPDGAFAPERDNFFVPPSLGSLASHVRGFILTGKPNDNEIRQTLQDIGGGPAFVLARSHLSIDRRALLCGRNPAILVDDDLVAYMAFHPGSRVRKLLEVGLLTAYMNPYADYGGAPVPPEMFFGRQTELNKLRNVQSAAILYGGRRLGKSSLLDQIERESRSTPGAPAIYISMDGAKFAADHTLFAWQTLCKKLHMHGVIRALPQDTSEWTRIQSWIENELTGASNANVRACYLLLDEADALMGKELAATPGSPSFIRSLQQLCEAVQRSCRVRYVIAGLHNITRMSTEENSPLGKADAIALEPYTTSDDITRGIELVTKPLAALGFYFDKGSEDLPLRILSVCNFYPAFIQLYCRVLLERLYNSRQEAAPPTYITVADLDAVERDGNLLQELQRKFELNLNLDKRYKAIALILADVYYNESDTGQYTGLDTSQIREHCEAFAAPHFSRTGSGAYEALVDEMRKLNVLERVGSKYLLRNPNIAMMMGDRDRISHLIDELARETPEQARNQGERRIYLRQGNHRGELFPLPAAWVRNNVEVNDGELVILVGNNMSGLQQISTQKEEWSLGQDCVYGLKYLNSGQAATAYLRKFNVPTPGSVSKRLVAVTSNSWTVDARTIADYASAAQKGQKGARLALLTNTDKAYELAMAIDARQIVLGQVSGVSRWRIVPIPPWSDDALHFFLDENVAVAESTESCSALLRTSCGYGSALVDVCAGNPTVPAAIATRPFVSSLADFYKKIGMPGAVDARTRERLETFATLLDESTEKKSVQAVEALEYAELSEGLLMFMQWMGLLQDGPANTWKVPALYRQLLSR